MKRKYLVPILLVVTILCAIYFYEYKSTAVSNSPQTQPSSEKSNEVSSIAKASYNSSNVASNTAQAEISNSNTVNDTVVKVKDYILNGQNNLSSAERLNWSKRFLEQVDIANLYKQYTTTEGNPSNINIKDFAKYITFNAPIQNNWQELFKEDLNDQYGPKVTVVKFVHLSDFLYQTYINQEGSEVPFVVVSARTGYFHG
ncbi:hypothetical protein [Clostridium akagii]|uniref:hypothetical protein n=1 Tax=Clostridium akagii TaxID=91623 RepID=UPI00068BC70E|nr:hypothetical protein [Clostridium akagii]